MLPEASQLCVIQESDQFEFVLFWNRPEASCCVIFFRHDACISSTFRSLALRFCFAASLTQGEFLIGEDVVMFTGRNPP